MNTYSLLRSLLVPRVRHHKWDDGEDDPLSKREGKYFNMGVNAAADELDKALTELEELHKLHGEA